MPSRAAELAHLFETPLPFPCTLAFGTEDPFYPWATRLRDVFEAPAVIEFEEGHRFPHSRQANEQIVAAVRGLLGDFPCRLLKSTTPVLQCSHARSASTVVTRPWWAAYARRDFARKMGSSGPNGPHRKPPLRGGMLRMSWRYAP